MRYSYEPFNLKWSPQLRGHLSYFKYLDSNSKAAPVIEQIADDAFRGVQTRKQLLRAVFRGYFRSATRAAQSVLVKDPTAPLIADWVAERFNARILVLIRHPCGFASSIEKLEWQVRLDYLLRQEALMSDYLWPYEDVLHRAKNDKWEQLGAFWAAVHWVLQKQAERNDGWHKIKYEDLCNDPRNSFNTLIEELGLEGDSKINTLLERKSAFGNDDPGSTNRLSEEMPEIWRQRLSEGAIDAVMGVVNEFKGIDYTY